MTVSTIPSWLVLQALSAGVSPTTGLPVTAEELKSEAIATALKEGAAAIVAANAPKVAPAPAKKGPKGPRKPRTPKVAAQTAAPVTNGAAGSPQPAAGALI